MAGLAAVSLGRWAARKRSWSFNLKTVSFMCALMMSPNPRFSIDTKSLALAMGTENTKDDRAMRVDSWMFGLD